VRRQEWGAVEETCGYRTFRSGKMELLIDFIHVLSHFRKKLVPKFTSSKPTK